MSMSPDNVKLHLCHLVFKLETCHFTHCRGSRWGADGGGGPMSPVDFKKRPYRYI